MKTAEMLKQLLDNPEKKFEAVEGLYPGLRAEIKSSAIVMTPKNENESKRVLSLHRQWKEVQLPVDPYKVIRMFVDGAITRFRIEMPDGSVYTQHSGYTLGTLKMPNATQNGFKKEMFADGKWYIE